MSAIAPGEKWRNQRAPGTCVRWLAVLALAAGVLCAGCLSGCRAESIEVTIVNHGPALRVLELDYPDASFGVDQLAAGGRYNHILQIKGSGPLTLTFSDAAGKTHSVKGPSVQLGQIGSVLITISDPGSQVTWLANLKQK